MADKETAQEDQSQVQTDEQSALKAAEGTSYAKPTDQNKGSEDGLAAQVATHYNALPEAGREKRCESKIFYQRNFNNWMKSVCIGNALRKLREEDRGRRIVALDLCCGKGGDLLKWKKGNIRHLVCADIAAVSVEQCEQRYHDLKRRSNNDRYPVFTAEFHAADCAETILTDVYKDSELMFDITSCQFSFHYSFESIQRADTMLRNACERLKPGGIFIGTIPDGCELVRRVQNSDGLSFGNDVYRVTFKNKDSFPLFGCIYDFHLEGVVDCPEFLVYFPLLEKMAKKYGMKLLYSDTFAEFFRKHSGNRENNQLLSRMMALEMYPPFETSSNASEGAYDHAKEFLEKKKGQSSHERDHRTPRVGTLSQSEWEATSLYLVFAFIKEEDSSVQDPKEQTKEEEEATPLTDQEIADTKPEACRSESDEERRAEMEETKTAAAELEDCPPHKKQKNLSSFILIKK